MLLINKAINKHSNLLDRCMLAERNALIEIKLYILQYSTMPVERFQFILYKFSFRFLCVIFSYFLMGKILFFGGRNCLCFVCLTLNISECLNFDPNILGERLTCLSWCLSKHPLFMNAKHTAKHIHSVC